MKNLLNSKVAMVLLASTISLSAALPILAQTKGNTPVIKPPAVVEPGLPEVTFDATSFQQNQQLINVSVTSDQRLNQIIDILEKTRLEIVKANGTAQPATTTPTAGDQAVVAAITALIEQIKVQSVAVEANTATQQQQLQSVTGKPPVPLDVGSTEGGTTLYDMAVKEGETLPAEAKPFYDAYDDVLSTAAAISMKGLDLPAAKIFADRMATAAVTATLSEMAYQRANTGMDRIATYTDNLNATDTLKQSVDINTQVLIELLRQSNEQLRVLAAMSFSASHEILGEGAATMADQ